MTDNRCDAGLPNGKRCKNDATKWIVLTFDITEPPEKWPCAVCDAHAIRPIGGSFLRLGPDRRSEYAADKFREEAKAETGGAA